MKLASLSPWLLAAALFACQPKPVPPNKRQPLPSPDGRYVLTVPQVRGPTGPLWIPTISTPEKQVVFADPSSSFQGTFKLYWAWDDADRVWLYDSSDGSVLWLESGPTGWTKQRWGQGRQKECDCPLAPPEMLYPPKVK